MVNEKSYIWARMAQTNRFTEMHDNGKSRDKPKNLKEF